jgi:hypothetical protein
MPPTEKVTSLDQTPIISLGICTDRYFPAKALDPAYVASAKQNSIRELQTASLRSLLDWNLEISGPWWSARELEDEKIAGGHTPGSRMNRIGQQRFREALLARYGEVCAFTGPQPPAILEAAHLIPYNENPEHDVNGGLLLRRDLHTLFDDFLITINPESWSIQVAPELVQFSDLAALDGRQVQLKQDLRPRPKYIKDHATAAYAEWKRQSVLSSTSSQPSNP